MTGKCVLVLIYNGKIRVVVKDVEDGRRVIGHVRCGQRYPGGFKCNENVKGEI
jgi:hypothetical protein